MDLGVFTLKNTATQVLSGFPGIYPNAPQSLGFEPKDPPLKTSTFAVQWSRMIDDTVGVAPELGVPSRIWRTWGGEIQTLELQRTIVVPYCRDRGSGNELCSTSSGGCRGSVWKRP